MSNTRRKHVTQSNVTTIARTNDDTISTFIDDTLTHDVANVDTTSIVDVSNTTRTHVDANANDVTRNRDVALSLIELLRVTKLRDDINKHSRDKLCKQIRAKLRRTSYYISRVDTHHFVKMS